MSDQIKELRELLHRYVQQDLNAGNTDNNLFRSARAALSHLTHPAPAQLQAPAGELSEQDATLLNQAYDMLLEYADHHRDLGNDSAAMGAECSADAVLRLAARAASVEPPAQPQEAGEHPPHRLCGCNACAPSFADETDPPATQASNPVA